MSAFGETVKTIRDQMKFDEASWKNRPRFDLFSYTPSAGLELGLENPNLGRRDEKGNIRFDPKNFLTKKTDLFSKTGFLCETSKFMDQSKIEPFRSKGSPTLNKIPFKTTIKIPKQIKDPYEYYSNGNMEIKTGFGKKGFYTSGAKTGFGNTTTGHLFSKPYEYISDPYERKKDFETKEREIHKNKMMGRKAFINSFCDKSKFTQNYEVFINAGSHADSESTFKVKNLEDKKYHGKAFMPSNPAKTGYNRTFTKFPEFMSDPIPVLSPIKNQNKRGFWKYNRGYLTGPNPSIQNYNNKFRPRGNF